MVNISTILTPNNPVFCGYMTYTSILVLKTMLMAILTGRQRFKHKILTNPEDVQWVPEAQLGRTHTDFERVQKAHLNDIENIPIFFLAGFAYLLSDPNQHAALILFRTVVISRCIHTLAYAVYDYKPIRALSFGVAFIVTGYMAVSAICHFLTL